MEILLGLKARMPDAGSGRLQRLFDAAGQVLRLAFCLLGLAVILQLGVAKDLTDGFLETAFDLFSRSDDAILVHGVKSFMRLETAWIG